MGHQYTNGTMVITPGVPPAGEVSLLLQGMGHYRGLVITTMG